MFVMFKPIAAGQLNIVDNLIEIFPSLSNYKGKIVKRELSAVSLTHTHIALEMIKLNISIF